MGKNDNEISAFLGKESIFKGVITYEGSIRIDGKMEGEIISTGDLIIGESAIIDAMISVGNIICAGNVSGDLQASKKIHLLKKARMNGSLNAPNLIIEEGVRVNGRCEMKKPPPRPKSPA